MFAGQVEKNSEVLGRSALWNKKGRISKLPYYLTVQFVRFAWRQELNKGKGDKAKMVKPVTFPFELDMYQMCSDELKAKMEAPRKVQDAQRNGEEVMDTTDEAAPLSNTTGRYELFAVLSHQGRTADSGHYVAWSKYEPKNPKPSDRKDLWVLWDDDKPSFVLEQDIMKLSGKGGADFHHAYLLLYRTKK